MKYQAILNKVFIKPDQTPDKLGKIYIPTQSKKIPESGIVTSIGELVKSVKVGQKVLFAKWEVVEVKIDNELHLVLEDKPEHLKAILK